MRKGLTMTLLRHTIAAGLIGIVWFSQPLSIPKGGGDYQAMNPITAPTQKRCEKERQEYLATYRADYPPVTDDNGVSQPLDDSVIAPECASLTTRELNGGLYHDIEHELKQSK